MQEERKYYPFPVKRGFPFLIDILCGPDHFHISVDGEPFYDYRYRLPLKDIKFLEITGDGQIEIFVIDYVPIDGPVYPIDAKIN